jgi:UDP-glucose 4-epimerase
VLDLATAHHAALRYLRQGGETTAINLGTGLGTSVLEIIQKAEKITGKKINVIYGPRRAGDPAAVYANPQRAIDLLGWKTSYNDVAWQLETAWKFLTGPRGGKF